VARMKRISVFIKAIFFVALAVIFQGCATKPVSFKIENSLPQSKLAFYNDSFDKLREDFWDKAGYMHSEQVKANFKLANMRIEEGKIRIDTKTGSFSKGGLASKYLLRGDFDIQVDCQIEFLDGFQDMDQLVVFLVIDRGSEIEKIDSVVIGLAKRGDNNYSQVYSLQTIKGNSYPGNRLSIGDFHGSLRIVRIGRKISTLYRKQGDMEWRRLSTFRSSQNDMMLGFKLQNYFRSRYAITAKSPVTAKFDNFRINAAREIVEEEI
jgi:hypothetical protein